MKLITNIIISVFVGLLFLLLKKSLNFKSKLEEKNNELLIEKNTIRNLQTKIKTENNLRFQIVQIERKDYKIIESDTIYYVYFNYNDNLNIKEYNIVLDKYIYDMLEKCDNIGVTLKRE